MTPRDSVDDKDKYVLGLFNSGNMSLEWSGQIAMPGSSGPQKCLEEQRPSNEPSLADMTRKAIDLLDLFHTMARALGVE